MIPFLILGALALFVLPKERVPELDPSEDSNAAPKVWKTAKLPLSPSPTASCGAADEYTSAAEE